MSIKSETPQKQLCKCLTKPQMMKLFTEMHLTQINNTVNPCTGTKQQQKSTNTTKYMNRHLRR